MKNVNNIFLIGYMGSGKTTMGRELAKAIGWNFVDLDAQIEKRTGLSVSDIFEEKGEPEFRKIEESVLASVAENKHQVVATGGGTPLSAENRKIMHRCGLVVYLKVPTSELLARLKHDRYARPLLHDKSDVELEAFVKTHLKSRISIYEMADVIFSIERGLNELQQLVNDYSR